MARQIEYGRQCGTPWGVSESAFSVVDADLNYQYQAFGVPGLGLKRGLAEDLVVAPYAAVMAVMVQPRAAIHNFHRLAAEGAEGAYGFYESIDYTRERLQPKQRCVVVKCFMAHHQGMALTALANCLMNDPMPRRFRAEPMVRAAELLLQESVAPEAPLVQPHGDETSLRPAAHESQHPMSRRITTPYTVQPRTHLLSSGQYTVMVTNAGGGRAVWRSLDVSRWREDRTRDDWGQFCYIRDLHTGVVWSAGHQPICRDADDFEVVYSTDKAEFRRVDGAIETHMEVTASPESHAEVRRLTLTNHDSRPHELELTSYLEVVLGPHAADMSHPAFNKLFLETEVVLGGAALLCRRRPRATSSVPCGAFTSLPWKDRSSALCNLRRIAPGFSAAAARRLRPPRWTPAPLCRGRPAPYLTRFSVCAAESESRVSLPSKSRSPRRGRTHARKRWRLRIGTTTSKA